MKYCLEFSGNWKETEEEKATLLSIGIIILYTGWESGAINAKLIGNRKNLLHWLKYYSGSDEDQILEYLPFIKPHIPSFTRIVDELFKDL